ncbi:hypothetical protein M011DRAFT_151889 [Sporormia fimetaria CBS 119925]|uniref:Uncharacterized protein n=1 Tax=Sporormia fimetaria CBS 119925 TaxID=1340428 RepID=A0A6A6V6S4_9PLEO|nr:hypothetical protein M011DRAFT_151889 [Sporormia fimetaria CBS 119925]
MATGATVPRVACPIEYHLLSHGVSNPWLRTEMHHPQFPDDRGCARALRSSKIARPLSISSDRVERTGARSNQPPLFFCQPTIGLVMHISTIPLDLNAFVRLKATLLLSPPTSLSGSCSILGGSVRSRRCLRCVLGERAVCSDSSLIIGFGSALGCTLTSRVMDQ